MYLPYLVEQIQSYKE